MGDVEGPEAWVARTKLLRPEVAADAVIDPALLQGTVRAVTSMPVTLVSAQAGAGKTTLAGAAADAAGLPVAWVALDAGDDDLASLLHLLVSAIETVVPDGCPAARELLRSDLPAAVDPRRAAGVLVNDVVAADPPLFLLVLDDVHVLGDTDALALLDLVLAQAPPMLRVVLTTRTDPTLSLSRLRATRRLAEVRSDDLRLGVGQAEQVLNHHLGLGLTPEAVAAVVEAVAGWATGIQLLGRSLDRGTVLAASPELGSAADPSVLYDYLAEEILGAEDPATVAFLLDTSVLGTVTPRAAAAVSGRGDAEAVSADLNRRLPFLVPAVERARGVYRYHDLFSSFLLRRLAATDPDRLARQHRRAADAVADPGARIEHLLAAEDWDAAARAIEDLGRATFPGSADVARAATWAARVPGHRPWLDLLQGVAAAAEGDRAGAVRHLERALAPADAFDDLLGRWLTVRTLHLVTNDHARLVPQQAAMAATPEFATLAPAIRVDHHIGSAYGCMYTERWDAARDALFAALDLTMATGDAGAVEVLAQHISPLLTAVDGGLDRIEAYLAWATPRIGDEPSVERLGVLHQRTLTAFLRGRFAEALDAAAAGRVLLDRLGGSPYLRSTFDWVESGAWFARGDMAHAEALLRRRQEEAAPTDLDAAMNEMQIAFWARVLRAQGRGPEVAALGARRLADPHGPVSAAILELLQLALQAEAAAAAGDRTAAEAHLRSGIEIEDRVRMIPFLPSLRAGLALLLADAGRGEEADRELAVALRTAEARGMPGLVAPSGPGLVPLLERAAGRGVCPATTAAVLAALDQGPARAAVAVPGSPEILSPREVEVLRLLTEGASNRQIAEGLFISEHTVKTHVRHVMAKLGARSRAHAAARARADHLV